MATISNQQVFVKLAERVNRLFIRYELVEEQGDKDFVDFDRLISAGMDGVKEYGLLLGQYLAALTTYVETDGFDTLMVVNSQYGSPIGVLTLPQIIEEHNSKNPKTPIIRSLVYNGFLDTGNALRGQKFHGHSTPYDLGDRRIFILSQGAIGDDALDVMHAIIDLSYVNKRYSGNRPGNLKGVLQVVEHEESRVKWLQDKSKEMLGYQISYHTILPAPSFKLPMPEIK